jgi:hypothetical protein
LKATERETTMPFLTRQHAMGHLPKSVKTWISHLRCMKPRLNGLL